MGSSCSTKDNNGGSGFNPGNNGSGFNPGNNGGSGFNPGGQSHRPHSRQAGNMEPEPANANTSADPMASLVSPQMAAVPAPEQPPALVAPKSAPEPAPQSAPQAAPQAVVAPQDDGPQNNTLIPSGSGFPHMSEEEANRAFQIAARSAMVNDAPDPMAQALPPQPMQHYDPLIIGALSADVSGGRIVSDGHWEQFEAANNVMSLEDYHATL